MKLGEIRGAIRKIKGNPSVTVTAPNGTPMVLVLQKTPLLETLEATFPGGKAVETALTFDAQTGQLTGFASGAVADPTEPAVEQMADLDLDEPPTKTKPADEVPDYIPDFLREQHGLPKANRTAAPVVEDDELLV